MVMQYNAYVFYVGLPYGVCAECSSAGAWWGVT